MKVGDDVNPHEHCLCSCQGTAWEKGTIILILAAEEATSLSSHSDWLGQFCLQGVVKGFLVLVSQYGGTNGFHGQTSMVWALTELSAWYIHTHFPRQRTCKACSFVVSNAPTKKGTTCVFNLYQMR